MGKASVLKSRWSTTGTDLLTTPRFFEGAQPLWTVTTGLFGREIVIVSIISLKATCDVPIRKFLSLFGYCRIVECPEALISGIPIVH